MTKIYRPGISAPHLPSLRGASGGETTALRLKNEKAAREAQALEAFDRKLHRELFDPHASKENMRRVLRQVQRRTKELGGPAVIYLRCGGDKQA